MAESRVMPCRPEICARCGHPVARYQSPIQACTASGTVTWCSDACARADGWPDDIGAVQRAMAGGEAPAAEESRTPPGDAAGAGPETAEMPIPAEGAAAPAAGGSPALTPRTTAMPRQELRIDIRVPLSGDLFDQAPVVAKVGAALDAFRAALAEASADTTISHEVVTPRPRGARG